MSSNILKYQNKVIYEFQYPIDKFIDYEDKIIVLLDVLGKKSKNITNVYSLDHDGNLLWQMENVLNRFRGGYAIIDMELTNNILKVYEWSGEYFILDINTGKVLKRGVEGKRPW